MKRLSMVAAALAVVFTAGTAGSAEKSPHEKAIKARQSQMQLYAWNISTLGAMAKGKMAYDAKRAQAAADNLVLLARMSGAGMWPAGSDSTALPGKTRAKKEIWSTYPKVVEASKAFSAAAEKMAVAASKGLDSVKGAIGDLGKGCGGCHKPFREEKK